MKNALAAAYRKTELFLIDRANIRIARWVAVLMAMVDLRREAGAVVWGRHFSRTGEIRGALTSLRRDVHRVEKGLVMRPRRVPFGRDYVPRLVLELRAIDGSGQLTLEDRSWATDVLRVYFEAADGITDSWLLQAKAQFEDWAGASTPPELVPTPRVRAVASDITVEQLDRLSRRRRSVRWFKQIDVDPAKVDLALQIAGQAPSACNRQNIRFHMVYGVDESARVLSTVGGTRGFGEQVPAVAVLIGRLAGYRYGFDRHAIYVDGGLASMGFLLGLEAAGLSSCCINWPDVGSRYERIKEYIDLAPDEQIIMLIAIGEADPDGLVPASVKRPVEVFRTVQS